MGENLAHDAVTHRKSWIEALERAELDSSGDGDYWRHERKALIKFLDWVTENHPHPEEPKT
tara:strand:- start:24 stop:206 length:183 start_codon:yes stop_codon:yes gene_type:complete